MKTLVAAFLSYTSSAPIASFLRLTLACGAGIVGLTFAGCDANQPQPGTVVDEAMRAGRTASSIKAAALNPGDVDYFRDMDGGVALSPEEVAGRYTWLVWTGGNDRLWDTLAIASFGSLDFLKTLSSLPTTRDVPYSRDTRWLYQGLVNEPCMRRPTAPDPNRYGLWLDVRDPSCPPDPFADAAKYPGVAFGARGKTVPVGSYYGEPTGVVGLRLFPNPDFDENARRRWNAERYYSDPKYYLSKDLVRPYRVGMSCAFCHVGPNPLKPPADPNNPRWENLSSNVGAQYFWWDRIFNWRGDYNADSFFFQILHVSPPGTLDTSLVSTDNINNPRTMNAVYMLGPRLGLARKLGKETLAGGSLNNSQLNSYVPPGSPLTQYFTPPSTVWTPRVLKDGADSVGALGALNRVFINIGTFSEEWLLHFRPLIGGKPISPIEISVARQHSTYWNATEAQTPNVALFFLKSTEPHHLRDAPGGARYLAEDAATLDQGRTVFGERCARCHSSKQPALPPDLDLENCNGPGYMNCWDRYWAWTKTGEYKNQMRAIVRANDFLDGNYLSTDMRVPVTLLQTNACSPLATNAIRDNIWDNFSSESYKTLPSVGSIKVWNPLSETDPAQPKEVDYEILGGGRGFTRVPSLISAWSTAPFLLNNSVGPFDQSPSVEARMRVFQASIEQMLWPERRQKDVVFGNENRPGVGHIDRTTADSYIWVPEGYIPAYLRPLVGIGRRLFPFLFHDGDVRIGPIPKGVPTSMLGNVDMLAADESLGERLQHRKDLLKLVVKAKHDLKKDEHNVEAFRNLVPELLKLSKCRDYVTNKGHYFGTSYFAEEPGLTDLDKRALIAFLKTF
jgi:cytochrome c2